MSGTGQVSGPSTTDAGSGFPIAVGIGSIGEGGLPVDAATGSSCAGSGAVGTWAGSGAVGTWAASGSGSAATGSGSAATGSASAATGSGSAATGSGSAA